MKSGYSERVLGNSCVVERLHSGFFRVITEDGRDDQLRAVHQLHVGDVGRTVYYSDGMSYGLTRFDADPTVEFDFEKAKSNYPYGWKDEWPDGQVSLGDKLAKAIEKSEAQDVTKEAINLDEYEQMPSRVDGFDVYRKILRDENGNRLKGIWAAAKDGVEPFRISYEQALGRVPIEDTPIKRLARELGDVLLP